MKVQLIAISTLSIVFSQYNVFDINNYNYFQDSIRVSSPVPMFKSFILPGWGQLSKKDSKWKSFVFFGVEIITAGSNLHYSKKSNDFKNSFENHADMHWDLKRWYENTKLIFPDRWSDIIIGTHKLGLKINGDYFNTNSLESLAKQYAWSDIQVVRDRDFYENIGKYDQFVGGWDDKFDDPFDGEGNWYTVKKGNVESVILTKKKNHYRDLRYKSNINSHYARYAISILMLNHFISGLDALISPSNVFQKNSRFSIKLTPYKTLNEGGVLLNLSW
jgi:hypothetical protein